MRRRRIGWWGLGLALAAAVCGTAEAGIPTDQLRQATDRVLQTLQDPALKAPGKVDDRRKRIRAIADEIFDWQETAKRALGQHWAARSPQEQKEFAGLFADLVEQAYIGKIERYSGERIVYAGEHADGDQATVKTKLITQSSTEVPIDYRMQREGARWRAYDVVIEGVGLVSNYRTQFNRIVQQSGYPELVKKLKAKQGELEFESGQPSGKAAPAAKTTKTGKTSP